MTSMEAVFGDPTISASAPLMSKIEVEEGGHELIETGVAKGESIVRDCNVNKTYSEVDQGGGCEAAWISMRGMLMFDPSGLG